MKIKLEDNKLIPLIGDINYKKPRLTKNEIRDRLRGLNYNQKLEFLEAAFQQIKMNKNENNEALYNEREEFNITYNDEIMSPAQYKDIKNLQLIYLEEIREAIKKMDPNNVKNIRHFYTDQLRAMRRNTYKHELMQFDNNANEINDLFDKILKSTKPDDEIFKKVDEFLTRENLQSLDTVSSELHYDLVSNMRVIGYEVTTPGVCYGACAMAVGSILLGDTEALEARLDTQFTIPSSQAREKATLLKEKMNDHETLNDQEVDLLAFFDGIKIGIDPKSHPELFDKRPMQNINFTKQLTTSAELEKRGGIDELILHNENNPRPLHISKTERGTGVLNHNVRYYLNSLASTVETNSLHDQPLALIIDLNQHSVTVGYDPKSKEWMYFDINALPIKRTKDLNELDQFLNESIRFVEVLTKTPRKKQVNISVFVPHDVANAYKIPLQNWMDYWRNIGDFFALKELLKSMPPEQRLDFLHNNIGQNNIGYAAELMKNSFKLTGDHERFAKFLDATVGTLPNDQLHSFMKEFLNAEFVNSITNSDHLECALQFLDDEKKAIFIDFFQLQQYQKNGVLNQNQSTTLMTPRINAQQSETHSDHVSNQNKESGLSSVNTHGQATFKKSINTLRGNFLATQRQKDEKSEDSKTWKSAEPSKTLFKKNP